MKIREFIEDHLKKRLDKDKNGGEGSPIKGVVKRKNTSPSAMLRIPKLLGIDFDTGCLDPFAPVTSSARLTTSKC
jgi:hypothetical protein